jgi:hypothetical protein
MDEDQLYLPPSRITPRLASEMVRGNGGTSYRIRFFSDRSGAVTLENPLEPRLSGEYETIEAVRFLSVGTARKMNAKSLVIEDNNGNVIERWGRTWIGSWRSL